MEPCTQTKNIEKLVNECEDIKNNEGNVAVALEKLTNKIDNVEDKLDEVLEIVKDHSNRLSKLEKIWLAVKWVSIGIGITMIVNTVGIVEFVQGILF